MRPANEVVCWSLVIGAPATFLSALLLMGWFLSRHENLMPIQILAWAKASEALGKPDSLCMTSMLVVFHSGTTVLAAVLKALSIFSTRLSVPALVVLDGSERHCLVSPGRHASNLYRATG